MSGHMAQQDNIIWAFDLDGTITDYGEAVPENIAKRLNDLGHIHIISGGCDDIVRNATKRIHEKTIHGLRSWRGNHSLDLSKIIGVTKKSFQQTAKHQLFRKELCLALRNSFHQEIYIGGRSTIDIMPMRNKGHVVKRLQGSGKQVIYFYDCKWSMNDTINNDVPAVKEAWKSVRTSVSTFITDLNECLKTLS